MLTDTMNIFSYQTIFDSMQYAVLPRASARG